MIQYLKNQKRNIIQLTTSILYNLNFKGFKTASIYNGSLKRMCVPGLNCYACPGSIASCPIGSMQALFVESKYKHNIIDKVPFYAVGLIVVFGVIFGRVVCGFLCPFGFFQELLYKIKTKKIFKKKITQKLIYIKYIVLLLFVIIIPLVAFNPGFCKYICPQGTLEAGIFHVIRNESLRKMIGPLFLLKSTILIFTIIFSILLYRFFCKFLCPLGALYSFFNGVSVLGVKVDASKCVHCDACVRSCLMDVKVVGDKECIECGDCIKICPHDAISRKDFNK